MPDEAADAAATSDVRRCVYIDDGLAADVAHVLSQLMAEHPPAVLELQAPAPPSIISGLDSRGIPNRVPFPPSPAAFSHTADSAVQPQQQQFHPAPWNGYYTRLQDADTSFPSTSTPGSPSSSLDVGGGSGGGGDNGRFAAGVAAVTGPPPPAHISTSRRAPSSPPPPTLDPSDPSSRRPFCGPHGVVDAEEAAGVLMHVAHELTRTCVEMARRTTTGLAPEIVTFAPGGDFSANRDASHSLLRPETVESIFVLARIVSGDGEGGGRAALAAAATQGHRSSQAADTIPAATMTPSPTASSPSSPSAPAAAAALALYRGWAWELFDSIERHARVRGGGYAGVENVNVWPLTSGGGGGGDAGSFNYSAGRANMRDHMESFFLAETLKYVFLTFSEMPGEGGAAGDPAATTSTSASGVDPTPSGVSGGVPLSLRRFVFNTEAHPLQIAPQPGRRF